MFHKILVVIDRCEFDQRVIQEAFSLAQLSESQLSLLHIVERQNESMVFILSELNRQKDWAGVDRACWNALAEQKTLKQRSTLIRQKTKLKVATGVTEKLEPLVFNPVQGTSERITTKIAAQARNLGQAIADVAQLCKADLIVMGLSQNARSKTESVCHDVIQVANCPVLIVHLSVNCEES